jgi:glycosyltransferase involved in cell wall biosynthesis
MIAELEHLGWTVDLVDLGDGFPWPSDETRGAAQARLLAVPVGGAVVVDGLAFGVLPEVVAQLQSRQPLIALVHHPLAMESGLSAGQSDLLRASERAALATTRHIIVTSAATARILATDYAAPSERITVVCPGTDPAPMAQGSQDGVVRLLSVGAIVPRKGFDVLIAALAALTDLPWHLTIVGDRGRAPETAAELDAHIRRHNLGDRVIVHGAVSPDRLMELYVSADLFVLASRFEGYGMAYAEAIAHGLPIVGTNPGAIPDTVPAAVGVLVAPDDPGALASALRKVIGNPGERRRMGASARAAASHLPTWRESAEIFSRAIEVFA